MKQKVAAVFGIGGLGTAIVKRLISDDYLLVLFDIKQKDDEAVQNLMNGNEKILGYYRTDVSDVSSIRKMMDQAYRDTGRLDAMVYTSGIARGVPYFEIEEADWDIVFNINIKGAFFAGQKAASLMSEGGSGGSIVFISSIASKTAAGNTSFAYNASKAALDNLAESMARRLGLHSITVNTVNPGDVWTPLWYAGDEEYNRKMKKKFDEHVSTQAIKKEILPEDIAAAVSYYLSGYARKTTGQHIFVDGGKF